MLSSVLSFTPEISAQVFEYRTKKSNDVSPASNELWDWTCGRFEDADKMSSPLQNADEVPRRIHRRTKSALAWDEATENKAEIITLELDPKMIAVSRETFNKHNLNDRVKLVEGPADESLKKLTGQFDLVFVNANKEGYEGYVTYVLDNKLLSSTGLIIKALRKFYDFYKDGERVDVVLLPPFDGVTWIKWRELPVNGQQGAIQCGVWG
ncbi:O-methyltransferase [Xylaria grammica]|nr:O-methyltransferase [Xylaria grammica]